MPDKNEREPFKVQDIISDKDDLQKSLNAAMATLKLYEEMGLTIGEAYTAHQFTGDLGSW